MYTLAEADKALGYEGAENPEKLPQNVHLINCTEWIGEHSQYFTLLPIYEMIKQRYFFSDPQDSFALMPTKKG
jgi:hypothetical protein